MQVSQSDFIEMHKAISGTFMLGRDGPRVVYDNGPAGDVLDALHSVIFAACAEDAANAAEDLVDAASRLRDEKDEERMREQR